MNFSADVQQSPAIVTLVVADDAPHKLFQDCVALNRLNCLPLGEQADHQFLVLLTCGQLRSLAEVAKLPNDGALLPKQLVTYPLERVDRVLVRVHRVVGHEPVDRCVDLG